MGKFFNGWRRKVGCATLVLACVPLILWFRSVSADEGFYLPCIYGRWGGIVSSEGNLEFCYSWYTKSDPHGDAWPARKFNPFHLEKPVASLLVPIIPVYEFHEWRSTNDTAWGRFTDFYGVTVVIKVPDVPAAFLLSTLSAYLLLWKPRKRTGPDHA